MAGQAPGAGGATTADGTRRAYLALVTVQVLFGLWPIAAKVLFAALEPLVLATVRTIAAAAVMALLHPLLVRHPVSWRREGWLLPALALLGVVLNQGLFTVGLRYTTAVHATLIITATPVFTYALAVLAGRERLGPRRALGIGLALGGALYLIGLSRFEGNTRQALGDFLIGLNTIAFAAFLVWSKPLNERYSPFSGITAVFLLGALMFLPVGLAAGMLEQVPRLTGRQLWVLAFAILGPTVLTYALNATALRTVPASTVAVFIYLQPVVTALAAWWLLDDPPSPRIVPAALLVFVGVWLVGRRRPAVLRGRVPGA